MSLVKVSSEVSLGPSLHKKWSFPLRISSVNVTKSAVFLRIWSHLLKKYLMENFTFVPCLSNIYDGAFIRWLFSQKNSIKGVWESPEFTSGCSLNFSVFKKAGNNSEEYCIFLSHFHCYCECRKQLMADIL